MNHVTNFSLARLLRRLRSRLATSDDYAAWYGWQARKVAPGTWCYRDPRFATLARRNVPAGRRS